MNHPLVFYLLYITLSSESFETSLHGVSISVEDSGNHTLMGDSCGRGVKMTVFGS